MRQHRIRWGILGTSFISEVMAKAIHESTTSQLLAIGSRSNESAKQFSTTFSVPTYYDNYDALIQDDNIDAVYIGLPNHLHKEWIIRSAKAGKHILCEKPFVLTRDEAQEVISIVKQSNVICMEALMYRYHPFTQKIQEFIQDNTLGEIRLYSAMYSANIAEIANTTAGGAIRNLGCYPISLIRLLANAEPIELRAMGEKNRKHHHDNQASVILQFEDRSMAVVSTLDDIDMRWQFEVYGTKGSLEVITNPWLPTYDNKLLIHLNHQENPIEITLTADKSLYTYQIDFMNNQITHDDISQYNNIALSESLGNTIVLEQWLNQINKSQVYSFAEP